MISVIVPTFNRREVLSRCLQALTEQDCPHSEYEVIVVVDGSTDGTQAFLKSLRPSFNLKVIDQSNRGAAAARNAGLLAAAHKVVLLLDDDLICEPNVISEHIKAHESQEGVLAFGPVLVATGEAGSAAKRATRKFYAEKVYGPLEVGEVPAWPLHARVPPNSSIERELLLSFGGYDEAFGTAHEDVELGIRLWRGGVNFRYLPNAKVEHEYTKSSKDLAVVEAERAGKSEVLLCRKHSEYRPVSQIAGVKETRLFRRGFADIVLRSNLVKPVIHSCFAVVRASGVEQDLLLGVESNVNLLRSAVREAGSWKAFRGEFWMQLPVLLYHHIGQRMQGAYPELTIEPGHFELQMQWLKDNAYKPITPGDWLRWTKSAVSLPEKPVLITFDDAYEDLVTFAFPVLGRHEFPATVFVPTAYVGRSNVWDHPKGGPVISLMSADAIREWAGRGIEFGAHSRTHPELDALDPVALEEELKGSREELESIINVPVTTFAYPYGNYNSEVRAAVSRQFDIAFTTEDGVNTLGTDLSRLHRTMVKPGQSMLHFASRLWFGRSIPEDMRRKLRDKFS